MDQIPLLLFTRDTPHGDLLSLLGPRLQICWRGEGLTPLWVPEESSHHPLKQAGSGSVPVPEPST